LGLGVVLAALAVLLVGLAFTWPIASVSEARLSVLFGLGACFALLGAFACFSRR
jgi:hypothetical protein